MANRVSNAERLFETYIKGTPKQAIVRELTVTFCSLTNEVSRACGFHTITVYITTKIIKKNYDKRPAEQNDFILKNGWKIIRMPDEIYENKEGKRGNFLFSKRLNNDLYVASIEVVNSEQSGEMLYAVSLFRVPKESYLDGYNLIWSWKGGTPSS